MGAGKSKSGKHEYHGTHGQVLQQPAVQQQQPPYNGIPCDYHFIRIDIPFSIQMNLGFLSDPNMQMAMSDPNAYVPHLQQMYNQGYRLLSFQLTPGSMHTSGFMSMTSTTTLRGQAIFRTNEPVEGNERYGLKVIKSSIESGTFLTGIQFVMHSSTQTQTYTQHLYRVIHENAMAGCRLRCIEITGCYRPPYQHMNNPQSMGIGSGMAYGQNMGHYGSRIYGVDLFFEVPLHQNPELYQYQAVPLKLNASCQVSLGFGSANQQWALQMDWQGVMSQYLGTGWRLVEVFDDKSEDTASHAGFGSSSSSMSLNIIFIFEKPQSRMNDNTALYEGTMIEFQAAGSVSASFGSSSMVIDTNWDNSIASMGRNGWELITVLQTPATTTQTQFMKVAMTSLMWMFFQRKIVYEAMPLPTKEASRMDPPPPVYPGEF